MVPDLKLDATSDFKTKIDIGLAFTYKSHDGNIKIKVDKTHHVVQDISYDDSLIR